MKLQTNTKTKDLNRVLTWPIFTLILIFLVVCFGLGCAYDYNWSKTLYASNKALNAIIGGVISNIGLELGFFVLYVGLFSLTISSYIYRNNQKWKTITANIFGIGIAFFLTLGFCLYSTEWQLAFNNKLAGQIFSPIITLLVSAGAFCFSWFFIRKFNTETVFKVMFWFVVFATSITVLRFLICITWSRPRPKAVFADTNPIDFRPVWSPDWFRVFDRSNFFTQLRQSFPSGHTANSGLCIAFIVALFKIRVFKSEIVPKVLLILAIMIMVVTAIGRMVAGWHFLTDTSFGGIIAFTFSIGLSELLVKRVL